MLVGFGGQKRLPLSLLLGQRRGVRVRGLFDRAHRVVQRARPVARLEREALLACDLRLVQPLERIGEFPVVSFKDRPRGIRHLFAHQCAARADKGISAADMTLQEREGQSRIDRLHPEAQLADLDRQRIPVDAVDALPDDVAECAPIVVRRWRAAGPDARDAISEATRSREQEVSRPARGVDDCQIEKGIGGMLGMSVDGALDHRIESARKQALHKLVRCVVAAGRLPGMALALVGTREGKGPPVPGDLRNQLKKSLVDVAKFVRSHIAPVHPNGSRLLAKPRQVEEGAQERAVFQLRGVEVRTLLQREQAGERGQPEARLAARKAAKDDRNGFP